MMINAWLVHPTTESKQVLIIRVMKLTRLAHEATNNISSDPLNQCTTTSLCCLFFWKTTIIIFLHKSSPHEFNRIIILHLYFDPPTYNGKLPILSYYYYYHIRLSHFHAKEIKEGKKKRIF